MPVMAKLGICELTIAALSGWLMVATVEKPEMLRRIGLRHLGRIRQSHLDMLFMGTILTAVGIAADPIPTWIGTLLVAGAFLQPLLFLPLAVNAELSRQSLAFRTVNASAFVLSTIGWVALAVLVLSR